MRKSIRVLIGISIALLTLIAVAVSTFFIITADCKLQPEKLLDCSKTIAVFDDKSNKIEDASCATGRSSVKIENLKAETVNAFIASEDRNFYSHNGLNYKRMIKATYRNLISRSFKEGASTISQQLIKNTHLTGDKTIKRKLKEIKLTRQLEKRYSKDEIMEMYLNTIYFGHNCFGLQSAANFYFGTTAENLTLEQSATVVGLLTSPNNFSPFKNPDKCLSRRNVVLKNMLDCGFIDEEVCKTAQNEPLSATRQGNKKTYSNYLQAVFDELEEYEIDPYSYSGKIIVKTYLDSDLQKFIESQNADSDCAMFVGNSNGGVVAFKSSIGIAKRQIGSTAKPIFVYAPAIEDKKIDIFTKITDEPINFGGYSPENYDKKYHGKVSVAESIKHSYNIPAVKTLNTLNMDNVFDYAGKMGIKLNDGDKNLSLALGAMSEGLTLKQLCDCYSTFQRGGNFTESHFIKEVCDENGRTIYRNTPESRRVFSVGTCSLINEVLCETAQSGTAKKLRDLNFDVACKTGTCGNKDGNTDAYSVAYTSDLCVGVWLGNANNERITATGGGDCCKAVKELLSFNYANSSPAPLDKSSGTSSVEIDREEYEKNDRIILCDSISPKLNRLTVKCLESHTPKDKSSRFSNPTIKKPNITVNNDTIAIELCQTKYYSYLIKRIKNGKIDIIYDGIWKDAIIDKPDAGEYVYTITPYYLCENEKYFGAEITLPQVMLRQEKTGDKTPEIAYKDWYNQ